MEKSFNDGINIPVKMKNCNKYNIKILCDECYNQVTENKELEANLNLVKRQAPTNLVLCFLFLKNKMI